MKLQTISNALRHGTRKLLTSDSPLPALTLIGGVSLVRNLLFPLYADDYAYSFCWDAAHGGNFRVGPGCEMRRVKNFRDVAASQLSHYFITGGRTVAHTLAQAFLIHGKRLFAPVNTGVTLAQLLLAERLGAGGEQRPDSRMLLWLAGCFWFGAPHFASTCLWTTGSFNYLWMGTLQSVFILPYIRRVGDPSVRISPALMAPLGLLSGWSNEAGAGAALLCAGLSALRSILRREKVPLWMLTGIAAGTAGLAAMLLAPGNHRRMELGDEFTPEALHDNPDRTKQSSYFTREMLRHHLQNGFLASVLPQLPIHLPVLLYFSPLGRHSRERTEKLLILECASLSVPCALMFSPEFPVRAAYPSVIYSLAASAEALRALPDLSLPPRLVDCGLAALFCSVCAAIGVDASLFLQNRRRLQTLRAHGAGDAVTLLRYRLPRLLAALAGKRAMDDYALAFDIDEDSGDCYNHLMAQYYHVGLIQAHRQKGSKTE